MNFLSLYLRTILAGLLIEAASIAHANEDCQQDIIDHVSSAWKIPADNNIVAATCKTWPDDKTKMLIALAYDAPSRANEEDPARDIPFKLAILHLPELKVVNLYQGTIYQDATWQAYGTYFTLDTARYYLTENLRAFALRENGFREPGAADHGAEDQFTLFVPGANDDLVPVLFIPQMHFWYYILDESNARTGSVGAKLSISVEKKRTNGFADLLVTAKQEGSNKVIFTQLLKYNGKEYPNDKLLKQIEHWWHGW